MADQMLLFYLHILLTTIEGKDYRGKTWQYGINDIEQQQQ